MANAFFDNIQEHITIAISAATKFGSKAIAETSVVAQKLFVQTSETASKIAHQAGPLADRLLRPVVEALEINSRKGAAAVTQWAAATIGNATKSVPAFLTALQDVESLRSPKAAFLRTHSHAITLCFVFLVTLACVLTSVCPKRKARNQVRGAQA